MEYNYFIARSETEEIRNNVDCLNTSIYSHCSSYSSVERIVKMLDMHEAHDCGSKYQDRNKTQSSDHAQEQLAKLRPVIWVTDGEQEYSPEGMRESHKTPGNHQKYR